MCPAEENLVATDAFGNKLKKNYTLKVRLDPKDVYVLDGVKDKLQFAERATAIRYLIHHYDDIKRSEEIVIRYTQLVESLKNFQVLVQQPPK